MWHLEAISSIKVFGWFHNYYIDMNIKTWIGRKMSRLTCRLVLGYHWEADLLLSHDLIGDSVVVT